MPGRPSIWMGDGVALAATGVLVPGSASSSAQSPRPATLLSSSDKFQLDGARCHPWGSIFVQSAATCRGTGRSYIAVGYRVCNMSCATVWLHRVPFPFGDDSRPGWWRSPTSPARPLVSPARPASPAERGAAARAAWSAGSTKSRFGDSQPASFLSSFARRPTADATAGRPWAAPRQNDRSWMNSQ